MGAVTGSSKQPVILSGSDIRDILTTLTQDRRAITPPAHLRVTTSTCLHRLLTELARKLQCFHLCTQRVRDSEVFLYNADRGPRSNRAKTVQGIQMWFFLSFRQRILRAAVVPHVWQRNGDTKCLPAKWRWEGSSDFLSDRRPGPSVEVRSGFSSASASSLQSESQRSIQTSEQSNLSHK